MIFWIQQYWLFLLLLLIYTAVLVRHAWEGKQRSQLLADYYVGGRSLGGVALGLSFFATYSSTNSFVGFSGQAYDWGLPWLILVPFVVAMSMAAWLWVAPRLREATESLDSLTIPDFIGFRFGSGAARIAAAAIVLLASFFYMTAVFKGIGNLLEAFLGIDYRAAIGIVFLVVMLYTAVGGFISVIKTDAVQGVVMVFAAALLFTGTVDAAGGLGAVLELRSRPATADLFTWNAGIAFPVLIGVIVAGTIKFLVEPRQLSRFYALADGQAARRGVWISTATFAFAYTLLVPIGLYARNIFPTEIQDTDLVVPALLTAPDIFGPGAAAFLLVAMIAAAMSSLDSVLLVMASTCQRDLVGLLVPAATEASAIRNTRGYVVIFAAITAVIALNPPAGIVGLTALSGSVYGACFFPAVVLGLHWPRGNGRAVLASFATGLLTLAIWGAAPWSDILHEVFPALLLSTAVYVGVALRTPPHTPPEIASMFAEREPVAAMSS